MIPCKEITVCQIKDREGFPVFLEKLQEKGIRHTVEAIPEAVYHYAQQILCERYLVKVSDGGIPATSAVPSQSNVKEFETWSEYHFPVESESSELLEDDSPTQKSGLIKSAIDSFVLVRIYPLS